MLDRKNPHIKRIRLDAKRAVQEFIAADTENDYTYQTVVSIAIKPRTYKGRDIEAMLHLYWSLNPNSTGWNWDEKIYKEIEPLLEIDPTPKLEHWTPRWGIAGKRTIAYMDNGTVVVCEADLSGVLPSRYCVVHDGTLFL